MSIFAAISAQTISRRQWIAVAATSVSGVLGSQKRAAAKVPDTECVRCGGIGRVPLLDAKPFVWLKGTPVPKWEAVIGEQFCPICQSGRDNGELVAEFQKQFDDALAANKTWEEQTTWKLNCVITRNAAIHTQLNTAQSKAVGTAIDTLITHFKRLSDSLVLAATRPDEYGLVLLWEKYSWDAFRKVMESQYALEQLGPSWISSREYNAYDHFVTPHMYETPQSVRTRPPSCGGGFYAPPGDNCNWPQVGKSRFGSLRDLQRTAITSCTN